jgi:hypothetical protein
VWLSRALYHVAIVGMPLPPRWQFRDTGCVPQIRPYRGTHRAERSFRVRDPGPVNSSNDVVGPIESGWDGAGREEGR